MKPISLKEYCPNSPFGFDIREMLERAVNVEAEMILPPQQYELPTTYEEPEIHKDDIGWFVIIKNAGASLLP